MPDGIVSGLEQSMMIEQALRRGVESGIVEFCSSNRQWPHPRLGNVAFMGFAEEVSGNVRPT